MAYASLRKQLSLLLLLLFAGLGASAQMVQGKLGYVIDGDSFYMMQDNGRRIRVRISGIDAPENEQHFGKEAKEALTELLKDKQISLTPDGSDRQGRMVAHIQVEGKNVAQELIRQGYAWHYKKYSQDVQLAQLEKEAQANKLGLWKEASPLAPWKFREHAKTTSGRP